MYGRVVDVKTSHRMSKYDNPRNMAVIATGVVNHSLCSSEISTFSSSCLPVLVNNNQRRIGRQTSTPMCPRMDHTLKQQ